MDTAAREARIFSLNYVKHVNNLRLKHWGLNVARFPGFSNSKKLQLHAVSSRSNAQNSDRLPIERVVHEIRFINSCIRCTDGKHATQRLLKNDIQAYYYLTNCFLAKPTLHLKSKLCELLENRNTIINKIRKLGQLVYSTELAATEKAKDPSSL
jgi:hypothetical protein